MNSADRTAYRTCPFCEAMCGLELELSPDRVTGIRGDAADPFSRGYLCPKGASLGRFHDDPDRIRTPRVRRGETWNDVGWDEALDEVRNRLLPIIEQHGREAVAVYMGNPLIHDYAAALYVPVFLKALGTPYRFSAATVDQLPKLVASGLMFGSEDSVAVPDVDRTDYLLVLGANPLVSNGSLFSAPDMPTRLRELRERGGRLVVVDPRRSRTAEVADEHLPIRPATDALLLAALAYTLFDEDLVRLGHAAPHISGLEEVRRAVAPFAPEKVSAACDVDASTIRRIARELAAAPSAAVYGRIGTTTTTYGTVASWLVDVVNTLTGNLDRPGGVMFPLPAHGSANTRGPQGIGRGIRIPGSRRTRVRGLASALGEFPVATLAEEIDTPGPDGERVRALVTIAGNPALSTPNSRRLQAALGSLELVVSLDVYLNETTRYADVILPGPSPLARAHYDTLFTTYAVRNVARWSPPVVAPEPKDRSMSQILLALSAMVRDDELDPEVLDDVVALELAEGLVSDTSSRLYGEDPVALVATSGHAREERLLDLRLKAGPYAGLSLDELKAHRHGLDLGPLRPRLPGMLRTPSGKVELAPALLVAEAARLEDLLIRDPDALVLVGRRDLRSNNSWMHNLLPLVKGKDRCTLHVHPQDAERLGLVSGEPARVRSAAGEVVVPVDVTDAVRPGVVSMPHGWGHDLPGTATTIASSHAGVNSNLLTDEHALDPLSGTATLNGIPVTVSRA